MDKSIFIILLLIVSTGVAYYFWQEHEASLVLAKQQIAVPAEHKVKPGNSVVEHQPVQYPLPESPPALLNEETIEAESEPGETVTETVQLPELDQSDALMESVFSDLYNPARLDDLFIFNNFIRHAVVSVDNLTKKRLPQRFVFTRPPTDSFSVRKSATESEYWLDEKNFDRYRSYIAFADALSNRQLVSVYIRYYPLFQQAYDELGYPGRYFNDRLIEVIDELLATPDITGPVKLVQPKVYYEFADPALEQLSSGQKILLRMGPENARQLKHRLKGVRKILTSMEP